MTGSSRARRGGPIVVLGDAFLDRDWIGVADRLSPDGAAPVVDRVGVEVRAGGAGLAAWCAATLDSEVVLVCALNDDEPGRDVRAFLEARRVEVVNLGLFGPTPEKVRIRVQDQTLVRVDHDCRAIAGVGPVTPEARDVLEAAAGVLVSDYGRGVAVAAEKAGLLDDARAAAVPVVWDPHPRGGLPKGRVDVLTPNVAEAVQLWSWAGKSTSGEGLLALAEAGARQMGAPVVLTAGAGGAVLVGPDRRCAVIPTTPVRGDSCGAGDRLAATLAVRLGRGASLEAAARDAVEAATQLVARGLAVLSSAGVLPSARASQAVELAASVRARGGVVVVAGGCFDLLHAGHVRLLESARALGDCLVVCLNDDESVRRLKGPDRPVVSAEDRADVLRSLACVDAVEMFGEDTPVTALERLRPHLFVKGGDYAGAALPEEQALARWGGRLVLLPQVEGRSTTRIVQRARLRVGA